MQTLIEWMISWSERNRIGVSCLLVLVQLGLSAVIIQKVAYTEIDWKAYMQEVEYVLEGERNYANIRGDTGPLVYPGGFVWIFIALRAITEEGIDILRGQYVFGIILAMLLSVVYTIYNRVVTSSGRHLVPVWALLLLVLSKRIQSIFVLRLFNDCIAALFGYCAVLAFSKHSFRWGCLLYSLGVSVKMNLFLMAPGILLVLWMGCGLLECMVCLSICATVQVLVALPFLLEYPWEYFSRAFEFSRVFKHEWTVNLKFLDESTFVSKPVSFLLLTLTVAAFIFFAFKWLGRDNQRLLNQRAFQWWSLSNSGLGTSLSPNFIVTSIFVSNFIGVAFARTLHYQFYSWYFHTLPWLLWHTGLPLVLKLSCLLAIEVAFNVFPATWWSSAALQGAHFFLLAGLMSAPAPPIIEEREDKSTNRRKKVR